MKQTRKRPEQRKPSAQVTFTARDCAVSLLGAIIEDCAMLSDRLAQDHLARLSQPADRARAQRLTIGVLRNLATLDGLLDTHLAKRPPNKALNILRLASFEICEGGDAFGVVHDAVSRMGRQPKFQNLKGMTNAVLRKIAQTDPEAWATRAPQRLPKWLRMPLRKQYSAAQITAFEAIHMRPAPLDLTLRDQKSQSLWTEKLAADALPCGTLRLQSYGKISDLPGFAEGAWWVQDAGASLPAKILAPAAGARVLDICAAPGGKTLQLASAGAKVTALDISEKRLERLHENCARCHAEVEVICADAFSYHDGPFDHILLDAPCSATGTIRRHPDLPFAKSSAQLQELITVQTTLLDHAAGLLGANGRLLYCTCSLLAPEGEEQITQFLQRHATFTQLPIDPAQFDLDPDKHQSTGGALRTFPSSCSEIGGMDGFYIALLQKTGIKEPSVA